MIIYTIMNKSKELAEKCALFPYPRNIYVSLEVKTILVMQEIKKIYGTPVNKQINLLYANIKPEEFFKKLSIINEGGEHGTKSE